MAGSNQQTSFSDGETTTNYTYYVDGLRKSKKIGENETQYFIWHNGNMVYEFTSEDTNTYAYGLHIFASDDARYLHNAHGDVVALLNSDGEVTKRYEYDAFGNELNPDANDTNPFRYCGEYFDKETGTIYLRARYYSPVIGRFSTVDPIRDGLNWYAYCGNSPVNRVDPTGLIDYIYTSKDNYYVENENDVSVVNYYAEIDGVRLQANSYETVSYFNWERFDTDFLAITLDSLLKKANEKETDLLRILSESVGGELDFKLQMDKTALYLANGILYNRNEAGNFVWAYFIESVGVPLVSGAMSGMLAQGGSILPPIAKMEGTPRFDEPWDRDARWAGIEYFYTRNDLEKLYNAVYSFFPKI